MIPSLLVGLSAATLLCVPVRAELRLELDEAGHFLEPGNAEQKVVVWLENTGPEALPILGGTLQFQIGSGSEETGAPRIVDLHLPDQSNALFRADNVAVTTINRNPWMSTTLLITLPEALPIEVWIPPFQRLAIATVVLDSSRVSREASGWEVRLIGTSQGDSAFDQIDPADRGMVSTLIPVTKATRLGLRNPSNSLPVMSTGGSEGALGIEFPLTVSSSVWLERSISLGSGRWERLGIQPRVVGSRWRWDLPPEQESGSCFYRVVWNE